MATSQRDRPSVLRPRPTGRRRSARRRFGVVERADDVDAVEVRARHVEPTRVAARGHQQRVVVEPVDGTAREREALVPDVEPRRAGLDDVDVVRGERGARAQGRGLDVAVGALQVALRQLGAVVGLAALVGHDRDRALEALAAQRLGGAPAGAAGADNDEAARVGAALRHPWQRVRLGAVGHLDVHVVPVDPHVVARERLARGRGQQLAGGEIERGAVHPAHDRPAVDDALGQRHAAVRAARRERVHRGAAAHEHDLGAAGLDVDRHVLLEPREARHPMFAP